MSITSSGRTVVLAAFTREIWNLLKEKELQYGTDGGFFETNSPGDYSHALGEAKLKISQYHAKGNPRDLIKVAAWLYLIYEREQLQRGLVENPR